MSENYADILTDELSAHGVKRWEVEVNHKHPQLHFEWNGKEMMFVFPNTPSDRRGRLNALTDLRKIMGVRRVIHKSATPHRRKTRTVVSIPALGEFTIRANPFDALALYAERAHNLVVEARWNGQFAFLSGSSGVPPLNYAQNLAAAFMKGWWEGHRRLVA